MVNNLAVSGEFFGGSSHIGVITDSVNMLDVKIFGLIVIIAI
jgi:hypothetical protein